MDDFKVLQNEVARLTAENVKLHSENKAHRIKRKRTNEENANLKGENESYKRHNDELTQQVNSNPDEWREKYETLRGQVVADRHKGTFGRIAKEHHVREEAIDDLYTLSGYKVQGDEPDEASIKGLISQVVQSKPYLVAPEAASTTSDNSTKNNLPPGPGYARTTLEPVAKTKVSMADMRNPDFMGRHQKEISQGLANGTMELIP